MAGITATAIGATPVEILKHAGRIVDGVVFNTGATQGYLVLFDKRSADVVLGTTVPDYFVPVSPNDNEAIVNAGPLLFFNGITVAGVDVPLGATARVLNASFQVV